MQTITAFLNLLPLDSFGFRAFCALTWLWLVGLAIDQLLKQHSAAMRRDLWLLMSIAAVFVPLIVAFAPTWSLGLTRRDVVADRSAGPSPIESSTASRPIVAQQSVSTNSLETQNAEDRPFSSFAPDSPLKMETTDRTPTGQSMESAFSPKRSVTISWSALWLTIWATGVLVGLVSLARGWIAIVRLIRDALPLDSRRLQNLSQEIGGPMGLKAAPTFFETNADCAPACVGILRPGILLPPSWRDWSADTLQGVLAHELAHLSRRDLLVEAWSLFVRAMLWMHPICWWAHYRMKVERERAADDIARSAFASPSTFAAALLEAAQAKFSTRRLHSVFAVSIHGATPMEARVRRILDDGISRQLPSSFSIAVFGLCVLAITVGGASATLFRQIAIAQEPTPVPQARPKLRFDEVEVNGTVKNLDGSPAEGVTILTRLPDTRSSTEQVREISVTTNREGKFSFGAYKDQLTHLALLATTQDDRLQGFVEAPFEQDPGGEYWKGIIILLHKAQPLTVTVFDPHGNRPKSAKLWMNYPNQVPSPPPVVANETGHATLWIPHNLHVESIMAAVESVGLDYHHFQPEGSRRSIEKPRSIPDSVELRLVRMTSFTVTAMDEENNPVVGARLIPSFRLAGKTPSRLSHPHMPAWLTPRTNDAGVATISVPETIVEAVSVSASNQHFASVETSGRLYDAKGEHPTGHLWDPSKPAPLTIPMRDLRKSMTTLKGRLIDQRGKAVEGAAVEVSGRGYQQPRSFHWDTAYTDAKGEFEVPVSRNMFYLLSAQTGDRRAAQTSFAIASTDPNPVTVTLKPAHKLTIRVLDPLSCKPQPNVTVWCDLTTKDEYHRRFVLGNEEPKVPPPSDGSMNYSLSPDTIVFRAKSNEQGEVEAYLPEGRFEIITLSEQPGRTDKRTLTISSDSEPGELEIFSGQPLHGAAQSLASIRTKGQITDADGKPMPYASIIFDSRFAMGNRPLTVAADSDGKFEADRSPSSTFVRVLSPNEDLGASATILTDAQELMLKLVPTAKVIGQLVDEKTKKPIAGLKVTAHRAGDHWHTGAVSSLSVTDEQGKFMLPALIVGVDYSICVAVTKELDPSGTRILSTITIEKPGQEIDLKERLIGPRK